MASIPKAFHTLEKKEITVSEYDAYLKTHPYQMSIRAIRCVECGDILTYCKGNYNAPYFKHSPTHEGHSYCSLYHEGKESKTNESLIRKKLFQEEDISLNHELLYKNGKWKSLITIPPFKSSEINENEKNKTKISIRNYNSSVEIPVDNGHFLPGEIKQIGLINFSQSVRIRISGNSTKQDIFYDMDGFIPDRQLYSSLVVQNYISTTIDGIIDLRKLNSLVCKRASGRVYTGRHYIIFSSSLNSHLKYNNSKSIEIKRINLLNDHNFNYYIFDVVFNTVDDAAIDFCSARNCELVQKDDASILWPPMQTVGNYHYYQNNKTNMFVLFENDSRTLDMDCYKVFNSKNDRMYIFFKIQNINAGSYYVTLDKRKPINKELAKMQVLNMNEVDIKEYSHVYQFTKGVINKKYDSSSKLGKNDSILLFRSQLDKAFTEVKLSNAANHEYLLNAIRFNREYMNFNAKYSDYLEKIYSEDDFVMNYIGHCKLTKTIKKKALEILMGEEK